MIDDQAGRETTATRAALWGFTVGVSVVLVLAAVYVAVVLL